MRFSSLAAASVAFAVPVVALAAFRDVPLSHPYATAISYVQSERIVNGYADGTYRPNATINRAEFTKIVIGSIVALQEIQGCSERVDSALTDIPASTWYADYVCTALLQGIIGGYPDNTFRATNTINTAEAAKILAKAFALEVGAQDPVWYRPYIRALTTRNALPKTASDPAHAVTRGEMAEMIYRLKNPGVQDDPSLKCVVGGCSGQLCVEEGDDGISTCEWRDEYACYKTARCERQQNGLCGWTQTVELDSCLKNPSGASMQQSGQYATYASGIVGNGKTSVLFFHAAWCPDCKATDAKLRSWYGAGQYPVSTYQVNYDTETALRQQYGIVRQNTVVLIDGSGKAIRSAINPSDADVQAMLGGK